MFAGVCVAKARAGVPEISEWVTAFRCAALLEFGITHGKIGAQFWRKLGTHIQQQVVFVQFGVVYHTFIVEIGVRRMVALLVCSAGNSEAVACCVANIKEILNIVFHGAVRTHQLLVIAQRGRIAMVIDRNSCPWNHLAVELGSPCKVFTHK